jgi:hypothetical protein
MQHISNHTSIGKNGVVTCWVTKNRVWIDNSIYYTRNRNKYSRFTSLRLTNQALRHDGVRGVKVQIQVFLTSALVGGDWSASCPDRFTPRKKRDPVGWGAPEPALKLYRRENSCLYQDSNSESSFVKPVASRCGTALSRLIYTTNTEWKNLRTQQLRTIRDVKEGLSSVILPSILNKRSLWQLAPFQF